MTMTNSLMTTYARLPVTFERGEGAWLWDNHGRQYLDALSGVAVCGLGHAHPAVTQAICEQAGRLVHTFNHYGIAKKEELAAQLARLSTLDKAFFCNSGAEATEGAIKIARLYGHQKGITIPTIIVAENSFHGRTLATLTATGNRRVQAGFDPLVQGFVRVAYNDLDALRIIAKNSPNIVAILIEPIQGEGGVNMPNENYLAGVRALCDEHDWLMILDEVQTGMCRTGQWFGFQHTHIRPDIITLAKALSNGMPIGACLARDKAGQIFKPGNHATTFGGNPLACNAALAVIHTLESERLAEHAQVLGERMMSSLKRNLTGNPQVRQIRGQGLIIGIELDRPCGELVGQALAQGLLINVTAERVVRLLPPLIISDGEADQIVNGVCDLIQGFAKAA